MHSLSDVQAHKVSQGACPHKPCKSSDAYTTYSDGSTYCFSCTKYTSAKSGEYKGMKYMGPPKIIESVNATGLDLYKERLDVDLFTSKPLYMQLRQYLDEGEIDKYFFYSPATSRYVFAHAEGTEDFFYEARGTPNRVPKVKQDGTKPTLIMGQIKATGILVVVEDLISAIKVGRQYGSMPLFGSYMSPAQMAKVKSIPNLKMVIFWLDNDKYDKGMEYAKAMGMMIHSVAVHTKEDPKFYGAEPIRYVVTHAVDEMEALQ
jgi:hypothetical protein